MQRYLIVAVFLSFFVNWMLISGTNRFFACPTQIARTVGAAAVGAAYACVCLQEPTLSKPLLHVANMVAVGALAFGISRSGIRQICVFALLHTAVGGMATLFGRGGTLGMLTAGAAVGGLCLLGFEESRIGKQCIPITLTHGKRSVKLTALCDTGNTLIDPLTGEKVLVIGAEAAQTLTGLTKAQLREPIATLASTPITGLRLIPYRAVGTSSAMLLAMRLQCATPSRSSRVIVAFAPDGLEKGCGYEALTGGAL